MGADDKEKRELARAIRLQANKTLGRMNFIIVENLADEIAEKFPGQDIAYFMALESAYHKYETDLVMKTKHLVFVDSMVDRYLRAMDAKLGLEFYFAPKLQVFRDEPTHFLLYGPHYDKRRSETLTRYNLPVQVWAQASDNRRPEILEALALRAHRHGRK